MPEITKRAYGMPARVPLINSRPINPVMMAIPKERIESSFLLQRLQAFFKPMIINQTAKNNPTNPRSIVREIQALWGTRPDMVLNILFCNMTEIDPGPQPKRGLFIMFFDVSTHNLIRSCCKFPLSQRSRAPRDTPDMVCGLITNSMTIIAMNNNNELTMVALNPLK